MEYVYAALLLNSAKQDVNEANIKKVIEASGSKVDDARVKALVAALEGVDIEEAMSKATVTTAAPAAAPAASGEEKAEESKEEDEKSDEKKEEEAAGGLASLFG